MTMTLNNMKKLEVSRIAVLLMCCVLFLSVFLLGTANVAYCEDEETTDSSSQAATQIETAINQITEQIYTTMRKVVTPITIVVFAWAGLQFLLGGNQGTEKARKIMMGGAAGLAIVIFAPWIGQAIATWFAGSGTGNWSEFNPL